MSQRGAIISILVSWMIFGAWGVIARAFNAPLPLLLLIMCIFGAMVAMPTRARSVNWSWQAAVVAAFLICDLVLLLSAFRRIDFATAITLHYLGPILVTILAPLVTADPFRPKSLAYVILGLAAAATLTQAHLLKVGEAHLLGVVFAACSAITLAGNILFQRRFMQQVGDFRGAVFQYNVFMSIGFLLLIPLWPLLGLDSGAQWKVGWSDLAQIAIAGVLTQGVGMLLFNSAARHIRADVIARLSFTEIVWTIVFGVVIFQEKPTLLQMGAIISIAIIGYLATRDIQAHRDEA